MRPATSIFWNRVESRLRTGWRIAIQFLLWVYAPAVMVFIFGRPLTTALINGWPAIEPMAPLVVEFGLRLPAILLAIWWVTRWIDHRPFVDLGLRFSKVWWSDLGFGVVLGALLMSLIFCIQWLVGWITITNLLQTAPIALPFSVTIFAPLFIFLVIGITEEIHARGYQLHNLAEGFHFSRLGTHNAVISAWLISSLLFGLLHVRNPNSTWLSTLALVVVGLFFGLGFVLTGELALSIGLHISWNFFQGSVFGFPVSGRHFGNVTLLAINQDGPALWTGGDFGPEAGLLGMVAILLGCVAIFWWVRYQYGTVAINKALACYPKLADVHVNRNS